jgi:peptidoglycan pentaglycine glycine transferase (the first glycine)
MANPTPDNLKRKMESDKNLESIRDEIADITRRLSETKEEYIAGAITIKYRNRVYILISGFNQQYKKYNPNYFLHYNIIEYYKDKYEFIDLNGITGDFTDENPYKGLNEFKIGFNPIGSEYIGEFDYIINEGLYQNIENNGALAKEFQRVGKKKN